MVSATVGTSGRLGARVAEVGGGRLADLRHAARRTEIGLDVLAVAGCGRVLQRRQLAVDVGETALGLSGDVESGAGEREHDGENERSDG